jgi:hypothetical protein
MSKKEFTPQVKAAEHFDSAEGLHLIKGGGFVHSVLWSQVRARRITRFTVTSFPLKKGTNAKLSARTFHRLVDSVNKTFIGPDGKIVVEEGITPGMQVFLAWVKDDSLTVIRADNSFKRTMRMELHVGGVAFNRNHVKASIDEVKNMKGNYGTFETTMRGYASRTSGGGLNMPIVAMLDEQLWSGDVVDLFANNNKAEKRANSIGRPYRTWHHVENAPIRVKVIPDVVKTVKVPGENRMVDIITNDGAGFISARLAQKCIGNYNPGRFLPGKVANTMRAMDAFVAFNGRGLGDFEPVNTQEELEAMGVPIIIDNDGRFLLGGHLKIQMFVDPWMPEDYDFVIPACSIKEELRPMVGGAGWTNIGLEPQGVKDAYEDPQTSVNQLFVISIPDVRERVEDASAKAIQRLKSGEAADSLVKTMEEELATEYSESLEFGRLLRWSAAAVRAYSGRPEENDTALTIFASPWLMEKLGEQWATSLRWTPLLDKDEYKQNPDLKSNDKLSEEEKNRIRSWYRSMMVPIRCAKRMQVVSESVVRASTNVKIVRMDGKHIYKHQVRIEKGQIRPVSLHDGRVTTHLMVVNDDDWAEVIYFSHGDPDADDFFVVRWVTINDERKIIVTRNPNHRGEYSVWDYVDGDWYPTYKTAKGKEITFPKVARKAWPTQILDAIKSGETTMKQLPTLDPNWMDPDDPNRPATVNDDRGFVMEEVARINKLLVDEGLPVDASMAMRLGNPNISKTGKGILSSSQATIRDVIDKKHLTNVRKVVRSLKEPQWLRIIGAHQKLYPKVANFLRHVKSTAGFEASLKVMSTDQIYDWEDKKMLDWYLSIAGGKADRAQHMMTMWHACWINKTEKGKVPDRYIFGTRLFTYSECAEHGPLPKGKDSCTEDGCDETITHHWPLFEALEYFGISREPEMSDRYRKWSGQEWTQPVIYEGLRDKRPSWVLRCIGCGVTNVGAKRSQLEGYHAHDMKCRQCRENNS